MALTVALGGMTTSCSNDKDYGYEIKPAVLIKDVNLNVGSQLPLAVGMQKQVEATITNADSVNYADLAWTSTSPDVATVSENGLIEAKAVGTTTIQIASPYEMRILKTIDVTVKPVATSLTLADVTTYATSTLPVTVTTAPTDAYNVFEWSVADESVATVDENGNVHGVSEGTTTVTAKTLDGSNLMATANVVVKSKPTVNAITLTALGHDMMIGEIGKIGCVIDPVDASADMLKWTSSNSSVATVDVNGLVTAVGAGNATITATDEGSGITQSVDVTVAAGGVASLDMAYMDANKFKALGWFINQSPKSAIFNGEGLVVEPSQTSGKRRADFVMHSGKTFTVDAGTYRYFVIALDRPGNGAIKLDTSNGDFGNNPNGTIDGGKHPVYYWDLQNKFSATDKVQTLFQIKMADITVEPYGYTVYWVHTFKTLEEATEYVQKYYK